MKRSAVLHRNLYMTSQGVRHRFLVGSAEKSKSVVSLKKVTRFFLLHNHSLKLDFVYQHECFGFSTDCAMLVVD